MSECMTICSCRTWRAAVSDSMPSLEDWKAASECFGKKIGKGERGTVKQSAITANLCRLYEGKLIESVEQIKVSHMLEITKRAGKE